jgi:hypothetical protein
VVAPDRLGKLGINKTEHDSATATLEKRLGD